MPQPRESRLRLCCFKLSLTAQVLRIVYSGRELVVVESVPIDGSIKQCTEEAAKK
ncbi:hypothetical protein FRUB_04164 [Fimbriiglobus ruber]|uniref:Uncharacterized protein n=1 Tax=Fimbriiglobus ruber TaxID=1908690 RepID=A0A225DWN4_9BACT|nr:hypothetical protein FRUB_04164 [Fimbriiglobus ruber]